MLKITNNQCETILNQEQLENWIQIFRNLSIFSFEIITDDFENIFSKISGIAFSIESGKTVYIPIMYNSLDKSKKLLYDRVFITLKSLFEDQKISKVGQNLKFNFNILKNHNIELRGNIFDIFIESYLINNRFNSEDISLFLKKKSKFISYISELKKCEKKKLVSKQTILEKIKHHAVSSANLILQLHYKLWKKLKNQNGSLNIFQNIEMPLVSVLSHIERNGVKIDPCILSEYSKEIKYKIKELKKYAYEIVGETFNLSSTKQLKTILFEKQGLKPLKNTPKGVPSTSKEVLKRLSSHYPLPKVILEYRRLEKLKSSYIDKLPLMIHPNTGRIHTSYHQDVVKTGRLSSTNPNLQNIPVRSQKGRCVRQAFIAPKDHVIISADYSQIELRVMAHLSKDEVLLQAFNEGKDIHCSTAAEIFNISLESVTKEQRHNAKVINFGIIYGISAFGLSHYLNISYKESQDYIHSYLNRYSGIASYIQYIFTKMRKKGYIKTLKGRRIYISERKLINNRDTYEKLESKRTAVSASIQGSAADIIKLAMISISRWLEKEEKLRIMMIMQVHDELVFEVHKEDIQSSIKQIKKLMENTVKLDIPLQVRIGIGENWDQTH